jgi:hypothetical protein
MATNKLNATRPVTIILPYVTRILSLATRVTAESLVCWKNLLVRPSGRFSATRTHLLFHIKMFVKKVGNGFI